jgi:hypothetical protein
MNEMSHSWNNYKYIQSWKMQVLSNVFLVSFFVFFKMFYLCAKGSYFQVL